MLCEGGVIIVGDEVGIGEPHMGAMIELGRRHATGFEGRPERLIAGGGVMVHRHGSLKE